MMILAFSGIIISNLNMGVADCSNSYERLTLLHSEVWSFGPSECKRVMNKNKNVEFLFFYNSIYSKIIVRRDTICCF